MKLIPESIKAKYPVFSTEDDVRDRLLEVLGVGEIPEKVEYKVERTHITNDGLIIHNIIFFNSLEEPINATICAPMSFENNLKVGVVCLPGSNGSDKEIAYKDFYRENAHSGPLIGWARELSRRGFVTLSISIWGCKGRREVNGLDYQLQTKFLAPYGLTGMGMGVEETFLGTQILASFLSTNLKTIGVTGFSLGGNMAWYSMACSQSLGAAVTICGGIGSMIEVIKKAATEGNPERHGPYYYIPHLLRYFDHPDIVKACIFPRPFLVIGTTDDEDMPKKGLDKLIDSVSILYKKESFSERFKVYQPEGKHAFRIEYFEYMCNWFKKHLIDTAS